MNTNRSGMGGHAPHGQRNASDARFVACPGKAEGREEAERPPALQSVGDPAVLLPASYPCARQSAIQRTGPAPSPPVPTPCTWTGASRHAQHASQRTAPPSGLDSYPTTPLSGVRDSRGPVVRALVFNRPVRGFDPGRWCSWDPCT